MKKGKKLYEGKAKIIYSTSDKNLVIQYFKDDATAFNNEKRTTIEGKGVLNNRISEHILTNLSQIGIENHLVKRLNMREQLIKFVEIIPIEFIIRNVATGSLTKRLGIEDGTVLKEPLIEYCLKDDKLGDPLISEDHIYAFDWANKKEIEKINVRTNEIKKLREVIENKETDLVRSKQAKTADERERSLLFGKIKDLNNEEFTHTADKLLELNEQKSEKLSEKEDLLNKKQLFEIATLILKDSGIKAKIIKQYVPIINQLVNKYLAAMDFFVKFELDENFSEKILSRHRDDFSYDSFSEGEKMRIDLSLLFTWRTIAKMKNSASTNLLILDEVFDASLDTNGCDEFLKILEKLESSNVFVISHKADIMQDKFHNHIRFEKYKNFSRIAA